MKRPASVWLIVLACALPCISEAQSFYFVTHRPAFVRYDILQTPHFEVIYQRGLDSVAVRAGRILEEAVPPVTAVVGLERTLRMPVVINNYNDLANAFVRPAPFKQEIELPRIKSKSFTLTDATWLDEVLTHELTHAVHAEINPGFGVGGMLNIFSEDMRRGLNLSTPAGFSEGVAVYVESALHPGRGRLNNAFFNMQYRAAVAEGGWRLAQIATPPAYTYPIDRVYIGGGHLFTHFFSDLRPDFFRRTARFYNRVPFLGYGTALWYGTGRAPWLLARDFKVAEGQREAQRARAGAPFTEPARITGRRGEVLRRPQWLADGSLVVHASGYSLRRGFYRIDPETGRRALLANHAVTEDLYFSVDGDRILFARYVPHITADNAWTSDIFSLGARDGRAERHSTGARLFAPVRAPDGGIWAIQNHGEYTRWVHLDADGGVDVVREDPAFTYIELAPRPGTNEVAVLGNQDGRQAIYRAVVAADGTVDLEPEVYFEGRTIFDLSWSEAGDYLFFSADLDGVLNIYAGDVESGRIARLTDARFGAMEPSLSPDGTTLAYVDYQHEQFRIAQIPFDFDAALAFVTPDDVVDVLPEAPIPPPEALPEGFEFRGAYRSMPRALRPRMLIPIIDRADPVAIQGMDLGWAFGAYLAGVDPLQHWSYEATVYNQARRPWGRATVEAGRPFFRPYLSMYDEPLQATVTAITEDGRQVPFRAAFQERGGSVGMRVPLRLDVNVFSTTAALSLEGSMRQIRQIDGQGRALSPFSTRMTLRPAAGLGYRLQRNLRDFVPNSGLAVRTASRFDVWTDGPQAARWARATADWYLPVWLRRNHGFNLRGGVLLQNASSLYTALDFTPRGYEDLLPTSGRSRVRGRAEYILPLTYVDDGFFFVPVFLHGAYLFATADATRALHAARETATSVGGGLALRGRLFFHFNFELRLGAAYLVERREWRFTPR